MPIAPIPHGYHAATPYLVIKNAAQALDFYKHAFGAKEISRFAAPDGKIGHAEIQIGDSRIMLSDEYPEYGALSPQTIGGTASSLMLYVENVDEVFNRAVAAGAKPLMPVSLQFYGDRSGKLDDPFGHRWMIATHAEDDPSEELSKRAAAFGMTYTETKA